MTKEEKKEYDKKYNESHKAEKAEYDRQYRAQNREKIALAHHKRYERNREVIIERQRAYHAEHREDRVEYMRRAYKSKATNHIVYCLELLDHRVYVGSTNYLNHRFFGHKQHQALYPDRLIYKAIAESGGWDQVKVHILMNNIPDRDLRLKLETHFINLIPEQLSLNIRKVATV